MAKRVDCGRNAGLSLLDAHKHNDRQLGTLKPGLERGVVVFAGTPAHLFEDSEGSTLQDATMVYVTGAFIVLRVRLRPAPPIEPRVEALSTQTILLDNAPHCPPRMTVGLSRLPDSTNDSLFHAQYC